MSYKVGVALPQHRISDAPLRRQHDADAVQEQPQRRLSGAAQKKSAAERHRRRHACLPLSSRNLGLPVVRRRRHENAHHVVGERQRRRRVVRETQHARACIHESQ